MEKTSNEAYRQAIAELLELMEIPEIRQVVLAKFEQAKLIFREKLDAFYKNRWIGSNVIPFPGKTATAPAAVPESVSVSVSVSVPHNQWKYSRSGEFFDTAQFMALPDDVQSEIFLDYFNNNKQFRREILSEFFLKKMPYADIYEANSA